MEAKNSQKQTPINGQKATGLNETGLRIKLYIDGFDGFFFCFFPSFLLPAKLPSVLQIFSSLIEVGMAPVFRSLDKEKVQGSVVSLNYVRGSPATSDQQGHPEEN